MFTWCNISHVEPTQDQLYLPCVFHSSDSDPILIKYLSLVLPSTRTRASLFLLRCCLSHILILSSLFWSPDLSQKPANLEIFTDQNLYSATHTKPGSAPRQQGTLSGGDKEIFYCCKQVVDNLYENVK